MVGAKFSYDCQLETRMATAQKRRDGIASFLHVEHVPRNSWKIWRRAMCDISQCLIFIFLKTSCLAYRNPHIPASVYTVYIYILCIYQTFSCHQIHEDTLFRLSLGGLCTVFRKHDMSQHVGHGGLVLLACFITNICTNGRNPAITTGLDA